jgi:hypothetical protein
MKRLFVIASLLLAAIASHAQNTTATVTWSYSEPVGSLTIYGPNGTTPLAGAAGSNGGVGFVLQLGYYTGATSANAFLGTWVPVFGPGTSNSLFSTAGMGDDGATQETGTNDEFSFTGTVTSATASTEVGLPSPGQIMSIRYYNATSLAASTYFGAISDPSGGSAWLWQPPVASPSVADNTYSFADTGVVYQTGVGEPETNVSFVPEPTALSLIAGAMGVGAMALQRRKRRPV